MPIGNAFLIPPLNFENKLCIGLYYILFIKKIKPFTLSSVITVNRPTN